MWQRCAACVMLRSGLPMTAPESRVPPGTGPPPQRLGAWHAILRNTGWLLGGKLVSGVLSLVYLGLAIRALGPSAFGQFVLILGAAQAIATLTCFETWQLVMRFGMDRLQAGQDLLLGRLVGFCILLDIAGAIAGAGLALASITALGAAFGWSGELQGQALAFCLALLISFRSAATGVMRLHDRFGAAAFAETMMSIARMAGVLVVIAMGATVTRMLIAWAIAEMLTALAHWLLAFRILRPRRDWWSWRGLRAVPGSYPGFWQFAGITNAGSTLGLVGKQFAVLLVGAAVSPAAAGGYRIAHQLGQSLANISDMLSRATFSEIMRARASDAGRQLERLFHQASRLALVTGAIMIALLLAFGQIALNLLAGDAYASVYPLVLILGTAAALDAGGVAFEPTLLATGRAWLSFRLRLFSTAVLFAGLFVLLNWMGTLGAALAALFASLIALVSMGVAAWYSVRRTQCQVPATQP